MVFFSMLVSYRVEEQAMSAPVVEFLETTSRKMCIHVYLVSHLDCISCSDGAIGIPRDGHRIRPSLPGVDVYVTSECIHLCILCIVTRCLFRDVSIMYLSHVVMPRCSDREDQ